MKKVEATKDVPEHFVKDNGVRVLDGVEYGEGKAQVREPGARRVISACSGDSMTKQSFSAECDIQNIVAKALRGQPVSGMSAQPMFLDMSSIPDYSTALNQVAMVDNIFSHLDAKLRQRFGNDPGQFVGWLSNGENHAEAVKLGVLDPSSLLPAKQPEAQPKVEPKAPEGSGA